MICPTIRHNDPNLEAFVKECESRGSGYMIDYTSTINTLTKEQVLNQLNEIGYKVPFKLVFLKKDNTERVVEKCITDKPTKPINPDGPVPVYDVVDNKYISFYTDRVVLIEKLKGS